MALKHIVLLYEKVPELRLKTQIKTIKKNKKPHITLTNQTRSV